MEGRLKRPTTITTLLQLLDVLPLLLIKMLVTQKWLFLLLLAPEGLMNVPILLIGFLIIVCGIMLQRQVLVGPLLDWVLVFVLVMVASTITMGVFQTKMENRLILFSKG